MRFRWSLEIFSDHLKWKKENGSFRCRLFNSRNSNTTNGHITSASATLQRPQGQPQPGSEYKKCGIRMLIAQHEIIIWLEVWHQVRDGVRKKNGYFTIRLTVSVDPPPLPPTLRSAFRDFFWPYIMFVFWNGFYSRKGNFHPTNQTRPAPPDRWSFAGVQRSWEMHL